MEKGLRNQPFTDGILRKVAIRLPKGRLSPCPLLSAFDEIANNKQICLNLLPFLESTLTRLRDTGTRYWSMRKTHGAGSRNSKRTARMPMVLSRTRTIPMSSILTVTTSLAAMISSRIKHRAFSTWTKAIPSLVGFSPSNHLYRMIRQTNTTMLFRNKTALNPESASLANDHAGKPHPARGSKRRARDRKHQSPATARVIVLPRLENLRKQNLLILRHEFP